jgi:hypothetical protein
MSATPNYDAAVGALSAVDEIFAEIDRLPPDQQLVALVELAGDHTLVRWAVEIQERAKRELGKLLS